MTTLTVFFIALYYLAEQYRTEKVLESFIVLYVITGLVSGYYSARFYKMMSVTKTQQNTQLFSFDFPINSSKSICNNWLGRILDQINSSDISLASWNSDSSLHWSGVQLLAGRLFECSRFWCYFQALFHVVRDSDSSNIPRIDNWI